MGINLCKNRVYYNRMSVKIINFEKSKDLPRSINPGKNRKLPQVRPKIDLENILDNMEKKDEKKVLFNDIVEIAQYEKPPELVSKNSPLKSSGNSIIDLFQKTNKSPSPNSRKKQKEITEYFKKEIETLDTKLGKRTRSPSPIRCSSPVKNYYKNNFERKPSPIKSSLNKELSTRKFKVCLDINWFKERPFLVYNKNIIKKIDRKTKLSKIPYDDAFILYSILGF
jgi:hypothetical protein